MPLLGSFMLLLGSFILVLGSFMLLLGSFILLLCCYWALTSINTNSPTLGINILALLVRKRPRVESLDHPPSAHNSHTKKPDVVPQSAHQPAIQVYKTWPTKRKMCVCVCACVCVCVYGCVCVRAPRCTREIVCPHGAV